MSNTNIPDDQVDVPEGPAQDFAESRAKKGMSPGLKLGILVGGVFAILGTSFVLSTSSTEDPSVVRGAPDLDATPSGALQAENQLFRDLLEQANDERAQDALQRGETFIPVPEGQLEPIIRSDVGDAGDAQDEQAPAADRTARVTPPPAPPEPRLIEQRSVPAPAPVTPRGSLQTTAPQQETNPYLQGMIQQMGSVTASMGRGTAMFIVDEPPLPRAERATTGTTDVSDAAQGASDDAAPADPVIAAGAILYGETLTSSSSDLPGPVLVEVTTGSFRGARLVGSFSTADAVDRMVVEFSTMTLPDGTSLGVNAFAVDGVSAETAVASDVNRRYVERYAPILAAAFITGYADSASRPDQQLIELGQGSSVVTGATTAEQNVYAGLAAAGEVIGADLVQNAPTGPEVILRSGWPIGIMFAEPVLP